MRVFFRTAPLCILFFSAIAFAHPLSDAPYVIEKLYTRCVSPERPSQLKNVKPLPTNVQREIVKTISVAYNLDFANRPVIFYVHGQGEIIDDLERFFSFAQKRNLNMISWDFPCYGKTPGMPSEKSLTEAGLDVLEWLAKKAPKSPVVLWGQSLGAAVVFQTFKKNLAQNKIPIDRMVVLSPWESFKTACSDRAGIFSFKCSDGAVKDDHYDNDEVAPLVNVPIAFVYSDGDSDILPKRTKAVMQKIAPPLLHAIALDKKVSHMQINNDGVLEKLADFIDGKDIK
jgi:Serine aminopeptidase, S33